MGAHIIPRWLCNVCSVLKINTHEQMNIFRNMHKIVSKLYFKNNQENIVTSANGIEIKVVWKKIYNVKNFYFYLEKIMSTDL